MTKLEDVAKAIFLKEGRNKDVAWEDADKVLVLMPSGGKVQDYYLDIARAAVSALRRPDMAAIMRASGQIAMRPSDVDLAVTHYLDAILKEPQ